MFGLPRICRASIKPLRLPHLARAPPRRTSSSYYSKSPTPFFNSQSPPGASLLPLLFAGTFTATAFTSAAVYTNRDTDLRVDSVEGARWRLSRSATDGDLQRVRRTDLISSVKSVLNEIKQSIGGEMRFPILIAETWLNLSEAQRTSVAILGINTVVFLAWQLRGLKPFMARRFLHDPLSSRCVTLLTSVFSHSSLLHFGFNSLALYSIGSASAEWLSRPTRSAEEGVSLLRSTSRYEFLAFFCAAGLVASAASHAYSVRVLLPRLVKATATGAIARPILPSLGASGAIYGCLSITALAFPTASVSLIFFPFVPIPITTAFWSILALDVIGIIRGWRMFDHVAHVGGATVGLFYYWYGADLFDDLRIALGGQSRKM